MIIRRDQMRAFQDYMRAAFEDRMVAHIQGEHPDAYARLDATGEGEAEARSLIQRAVERASRLGAKKEGSIQRYLELMLAASPDFESDPSMEWVRAIFADPALSGETRVSLVHRRFFRRRTAASQPGSKKE